MRGVQFKVFQNKKTKQCSIVLSKKKFPKIFSKKSNLIPESVKIKIEEWKFKDVQKDVF